MIRTCIDENLIVDDLLIIEAFIEFEAKFGANFYDIITKENFENDSDVKK